MTTSEILVVAGIAAVLLLPPIVTAMRRRARANAARVAAGGWPSVPGRIFASETQLSGTAGSATSSAYRAVVWYEYFVDAQRYTNNVIDIGDEVLREDQRNSTLFTRVDPSEAVRRYPDGADVTVYVDPADPKHSCLQR